VNYLQATDHNRTVLRETVDIVREHLHTNHGDDDGLDCSGIRDALEDATPDEMLTLLNTALCQLARQPRPAHMSVLAALDFDADAAP
jgi:hypothetical protein